MYQDNRTRMRGTNGFTLVEVLVVIGIIAVLIGILLPALSKARRAAREVACMSNIRQFGIGIYMFADQNNGLLPAKGPDGSTPANMFGPINNVKGYDDPAIWFNAVPPFLQSESYYDMLVMDYKGLKPPPYSGGYNSIFICPDATPPGTMNGHDAINGAYFMLFGIDSTGTILNSTGLQVMQQFKFGASYVWNSKLANILNQPDEVPNPKLSACRPGSNVVLMVEKLQNPGEYTDKAVQSYNASYPQVYNGKIVPTGYNNNIGQSKADYRRFTTRHRGGGHLLFADGHVAWFAWTDVQIQPAQMPFNASRTDANQYDRIIWSAYGPVN